MNDALLMRVLYGTAHIDEEDQSLSQRQSLGVAVLRDRQAAHQLHREVRIAGVGLAGMQHLGDSGVIHERQRLTLGCEARDDLARELSGVNDLDGNAAPDEARFLGLVHGAHASLTQQLNDPVRTDALRLQLLVAHAKRVVLCTSGIDDHVRVDVHGAEGYPHRRGSRW